MKIDGKPVRDAKKPLLLEVRQTDIDKSDKKKPNNCAAAVACKRQEHVKDVRVHLTQVYVDRGEYWERYRTPPRMRQEIVVFDRGANFVPNIYTLTAPIETQKLGARDGRKKRDHKTTSGKPAREWHAVTGVRASAHKNVWSLKSQKKDG